MPTYDYRCEHCGHCFEKFHSIKFVDPVICPRCNEIATKLLSAATIVYKGSGFYTTDYCSTHFDAKKTTKSKSTSTINSDNDSGDLKK